MSTITAPGLPLEPAAAASPMLDARERRLAQILVVLIVAMCVSVVPKLVSGGFGFFPWLLLGAASLMALALAVLRRGWYDTAAAMMLGTLTALLIVLSTLGAGLRDASVIGFPAVLVFAALLGNRKLLLGLLGIILLAVGLLGLANVQGWYVNRVGAVRVSTIVDISAILAVTTFSVALLAGDLARALQRLRSENDEVRRTRAQIEFLATHDALTGLPNRLMARDRFEQAAAAARRSQAKVALLYLDIDHFKTVNDSLGHPAGDQLLCDLGQRLKAQLRGADTVSRQGGDEFCIVLASVPNGDAVADVAAKVLAQVSAPLTIQGVEMHVSGSLGIALFPDDGGDFDNLLKKADIAMYRAKDAGRRGLRFFDAAMNDSVSGHLQLVTGMRHALERQEFELHYQPQICLDSGRIVGAEALVRWRHPETGLMPPGRFIPVAEQSGQIVEIGAWVLREACRQAAAWQRAGWPLMVSVNLSPVQVRRGTLERDVQRALDESGLPPALLELELTESLLIEDSDSLRATLGRLRAQGIAFAIDDFGTGYSNLAYLKRFEVERLKIDQSFVRRLTDNTNDEAIVRAIVQMAAALKLGVIAEGIEDVDTLIKLRELGCEQGQGFHWSPALPAARFEAFVREHRPA